MRWLVTLALLGGCGRVGFSERTAEVDAASDGVASDAGICHSGTFGTPVLLSTLATLSEDANPSLSPDERTIYFSSNRVPGQGRAIWMATRASGTDDFGAPTLVAELDSAADDRDPEIADDGLTIYWASKRLGNEDLFFATRATTADAFVDQGVLAITGNTASINNTPAVTPDELTLLFSRGGLDIAFATRPSRGTAFVFDRLVDEVNAAPTDAAPAMSDDGLELFFDSYRTGPDVIYTATRASTSEPFSAPIALTALDPSGLGAGSPELSADGRRLYFDHDNGTSIDIYVATRDCN
jgi:Tol biopolymer transport system component